MVVGRELCLLQIEVQHFLRGRLFEDFRKERMRSRSSTTPTTKYSWILDGIDDYRQKCCSLLCDN